MTESKKAEPKGLETAICPHCGIRMFITFSALSRKDPEVRICGKCGTKEALKEFFK